MADGGVGGVALMAKEQVLAAKAKAVVLWTEMLMNRLCVVSLTMADRIMILFGEILNQRLILQAILNGFVPVLNGLRARRSRHYRLRARFINHSRL